MTYKKAWLAGSARQMLIAVDDISLYCCCCCCCCCYYITATTTGDELKLGADQRMRNKTISLCLHEIYGGKLLLWLTYHLNFCLLSKFSKIGFTN